MNGVKRPDWSQGEIVVSDNSANLRVSDDIPRPDWSGGEFPHVAKRPDQSQLSTNSQSTAHLQTVPDDLPVDLIEEWQNDPAGLEFRLGEARGYADAILSDLDDRERQIAKARFHELPETAQTAVLTQLAVGAASRGQYVSPEEFEKFAAGSEEGAILTDFWRGRARQNYAKVLARLKSIQSGLSESDAAAAWSYFDDLPTRGKIAVMCVLAE